MKEIILESNQLLNYTVAEMRENLLLIKICTS